MKLRPTQIVGLVAIVVFGGMMIFRFTQPSEKDRMEAVIRSLPSVPMPEVKMPPLDLTMPTIPAAPDLSSLPPAAAPSGITVGGVSLSPGEADPATLGSQAAKDDLYCAGAVSAEFDAKKDSVHPDQLSKWIKEQMTLEAGGIAKLRAEGIIKDEFTAKYSLRWGDLALADYKANKLRIPVATCVTRAAALPPAPG